jgi:hypothetical protein
MLVKIYNILDITPLSLCVFSLFIEDDTYAVRISDNHEIMDIIFVQRRTLLLTVNHLHNSENLNKSLAKVSK